MSLKELLRDPPWLEKPSLPDVFPGAEAIATPLASLPAVVKWRALERERCLALAREIPYSARSTLGMKADAIEERAKAMTEDSERLSLHLLLDLDDADAIRLFEDLPPRAFLAEGEPIRAMAARHEAKIVRGLVARGADAAVRPTVFRLLLSIGTPLAAPVLLDAFLRLRSLRGSAKRTFLRFPEPMLEAIVPLAAGTPAANLGLVPVQKPAELLRAARLALHFMSGAGEEDAIAKVATKLGLASAWKAIRAEDPLAGAKPPPLRPEYLEADRPRWPAGNAMTEREWERFLEWLSLLDWDTPRLVALGLDPPSLHASMRSLFDKWLFAGALKASIWVIHALVEFGGRESVRYLHATLRKWKAAYQTPGAEVLDAVGTVASRHFGDAVGDAALELLADLSIKGSSKSQEHAARSVIQQVDAELDGVGGATHGSKGGDSPPWGDLEDRLVPRLGLDERGRAKLDFGNRGFALHLGTTLELRIVDTGGARLPKIPAARKSDDPVKAKEARARMTALRRDARILVARLVDRMQTALRTQKRWAGPVFELLVVRHPVVGSLARGLVWAAFDGPKLVTTFRISEDRTFADVEDKRFDLAIGHSVSVAHPASVDPETWAAWTRVLGDYEIIQPFTQLGWPVVRLSKPELALTELVRFRGLRYATDRLRETGFRQGPWRPETNGSITFERDLAGGIRAMLFHVPQPGVTWPRDVEAGVLRLQPFEETGWERFVPFASIDAVTASEMLHDLESAR